uniref:Pericentriolar material 1 protein C-terminal domain-containing protein n=1 Tax=Astatotilapia calliptera TaxID=8154 RepID=A0AAX7U5C8_ASTCA
MATGGTPFDDSAEELHNWTVSNCSLEDRLNNMDWGVQQKKANRSSEKNKKKLSAAVVESRLTNDISPESTPGAGRRRARTPHSFPHMKYTTQMSVPDQAELDKLRQRINFTDLDERSIGSDSQGRVTAANNQRQLAVENKKPYNFLPLHVNTNKSKELLPPSSSAPATPVITKETKKQSQGLRDTLTPVVPTKEPPRLGHGSTDRLPSSHREHGRGEPRIDSSQVVSKLVQIREYISKASSMRDDLVEKNDVPANVERLSHLIDHLKEQEKSYLRFLQKMLAQENEEDDVGTLDSAVGSGSVAESTSLNTEVRSSDASNATVCTAVIYICAVRTHSVLSLSSVMRKWKLNILSLLWLLSSMRADQKEELENLRKQHELLKKMLEQQEQLRALQGRQEALMAMQYSAEQALAVIEDTVVTETTGSVSGLSITSELNDELNDLIQRFHNQLHDSQTKAVPDNRRQAESLSLSREVCWSRTPQPVGPPQHSAKLTKLQELQDKKQTMDKILQELHSLRDQTLNNNSRMSRGLSAQYSLSMGGSSEFPSTLTSGASASTSFHPSITQQQDSSNSADKLRKLKEVHKRLNELRELVQYYEQTSDMMVDAVNENEDETEDGSMFEAMFDSEQENRQPVTNIRNPQRGGNWADLNSLTNGRSPRSGATNNRDGRLNTECEINNRSAANLRSLNIPSAIDCQYNRDIPYNLLKDEDGLDNERGAQAVAPDSEASESSRRSSLGNEAGFGQKVHRQTAKQKLWQLQELVAMVQVRKMREQCSKFFPPYSSDREKLYEEKLRQQKQELKMLHEERQKLIEIQGKIQDLQWACPDLQVTDSTIDDKTPLWSEMRRHQILREELRQRRKHLESLMAEHQRRSGLGDSACQIEDQEGIATPSQPVSRDERTMATWGSSPCHLDDDDDDDDDDDEEEEYRSEMGAEEEEEQEECTDSTSDDDIHLYSPSRNLCSYSNRKNQGSQQGGTRRQENLRWASELSFTEGSYHWQEQVSQLQRQLDYSTSMCQTLLQDQQTLSYMLQTLLTGQYSMLPNNLSSPQVQLIMHQLHQCYTQLAWQQNNIQRLKQVLNDLLHQQQPMPSSSSAGWQTQKQGSSQESSSGPPASPGFFLPFSSTLHPSANNMTSPFPPSAVGQATPEHQKQQSDPNTSIKTEYLSFPPPLQRSPLNTSTERGAAGWLNTSYSNNITRHQLSNAEARESPSSSPIFANHQSRHRDFDKGSQESLSSMPEPVDPTTITKTFKTGRKASAQANLASRSKTPKSRRRRSKGQGKNSEGHESDSVGSTADSVQERADTCHQKEHNQSLLDKLTQEKLDSKAKLGSKRNDLSSDASSDFSLFETLRETIYSEVATLISQNESRPHFLIELFHELQLLNTDYLRQRALYSLQDIVSRHLAERSATEDQMPRLGPAVWAAGSQSELTPSESLTTSDAFFFSCFTDCKMFGVSPSFFSSFPSPFCAALTGNTVIHLDKALARIREYERMKLKAEFNPCSASTAGAGTSDVSNAEPAGGEVHCPQIDTQQLDRQIKAIMTEVIPFLKENMDEVCSVQLLTSVRRMVLTLTQQNDESKEFVRFFHRQLGGILQDSLSKFVGRTLKDCGEDLLVEISEILFNELAFFRLMQDLDNSSGTALAAKHKHKNRAEQHSKAKHSQKGGASASQELYLQTQMKNSLSKAETQALTNYGSGEDENEEEEIEEFEAGPVDVQTSLQASADGQAEQESTATVSHGDVCNSCKIVRSVETVDSGVEEHERVECQSPEEESKAGASAVASERESTMYQGQDVTKEATTTSSPDTDSPVMISEVGSGNASQKSDEDDFVKVDDLPLQLTVMCEEELQKRIVEEQQNNNLSVEILNGNTELLTGLVGNAQALKEPGMDYSLCQSRSQFCLCGCHTFRQKQSRRLSADIHRPEQLLSRYINKL